jgi:hypothetical protein
MHRLTIILILSLLTNIEASSQIIKWEKVDDTSFVGTVIVRAPRLGYSYYKNHVFEFGYGLYIGKENLTIENEKKSFIENIKKANYSFNIGIEYSKINRQSIWTPKFSYVFGYFLVGARGDLTWQTHDFKKGYWGSRVGIGVSLYNIGLYAMKELDLKNNNPYRQNWGISFSTFIWGGKQKYIPKKK